MRTGCRFGLGARPLSAVPLLGPAPSFYTGIASRRGRATRHAYFRRARPTTTTDYRVRCNGTACYISRTNSLVPSHSSASSLPPSPLAENRQAKNTFLSRPSPPSYPFDSIRSYPYFYFLFFIFSILRSSVQSARRFFFSTPRLFLILVKDNLSNTDLRFLCEEVFPL